MTRKNLVPHSCSHCQRLILDKRDARDVYEAFLRRQSTRPLKENHDMNSRSQLIDEPDYAHFDCSMDDLLAGAEAGCAFMRWLVQDQDFGQHIRQLDSEQRKNIGLTLYTYETDRDIVWIRCFDLHDKISGVEIATTRTGFAVYAHQDDPAAKDISTRPVQLQITRDVFRRARNWIQECLQHHDNCPKPEGFVPTRLIKMFGPEEQPRVRLCIPDSHHHADYAALSYCWGGRQPVMLCEGNFNALLREGILLEELPKTLQDGLRTAQELGIPYLWVDSMCIVQDDVQDIAREIAEMPRIYREAVVTIKVSKAKAATEGFLSDRVESDAPHYCFQLPRRGSDGTIGSVILLSQKHETVDEPLDNRAWALQERILSPRVLDFASLHLAWICPSVKDSDGYTDGWRKSLDKNPRMQDLSHPIFEQKFENEEALVRASRQHQSRKVIDHWRFLLMAYTTRDLSIPTDRAWAISGIADKFGSVFKDQYLAGLWKFAFPFDLLWCRAPFSPRFPRPKEYQGPSWSWTSVECPVSYLDVLPLEHGENDRLKVLDCTAELQNQHAPYGAVRCAHITVEARLLRALWIRDKEMVMIPDGNEHDILRIHDDEGPEGLLCAYMVPDALEEFTDGTADSVPVYLLEVAQSVDQYRDGPMGIVLRRLNDTLYSRLGFFKFDKDAGRVLHSEETAEDLWEWQQEIFEGEEEQVITIV